MVGWRNARISNSSPGFAVRAGAGSFPEIDRALANRAQLPASRPQTAAAAGMTDDQKTIYALGLSIYKSMAPFNLSPAELELVKKGMTDGPAGKPALDLELQGPKIQLLATARSKAAGKAYLDKAATQPGAVKLPSGIDLPGGARGHRPFAESHRHGEGELPGHVYQRNGIRQLLSSRHDRRNFS